MNIKTVMKIIKMRATKEVKEILILFSIDKDEISLPYGIITLCGNGRIKFLISITILERFYISLFIPYLNAKRSSCSEKSTDSQIIKTFITCRLLLWVSFTFFILLFITFLILYFRNEIMEIVFRALCVAFCGRKMIGGGFSITFSVGFNFW